MSNLWVQAAGNGTVALGYSGADSARSGQIVKNLHKAKRVLFGAGDEVQDAVLDAEREGLSDHEDLADAQAVKNFANRLEFHPQLNDLLEKHENIEKNTWGLGPNEAICRDCAIGDPDGPHYHNHYGPDQEKIAHPETGEHVECACWCNEK